MNKIRYLPLSLFLSLLFIVAGCTDKKTLQEIQETQKEILAQITKLEDKVSKAPARPSRPSIDYNKVHKLPVAHSAIKGDKDGAVTVVEFSDFQCPYCSRLQPTLNDVLKAYPTGVRLVYKHYPLSFHKQAKNAAKATEAAREQGKFWEMHDIIFTKYNKLTEDSFKEFAQQLGLDVNKFEEDYKSNKYDELIQQDIALAKTASVTGTPTLFLNGKRMQRRSLDDFKTEIDKILKK